jgi:glycosyltransferase involved in cell wall biosynthesis
VPITARTGWSPKPEQAPPPPLVSIIIPFLNAERFLSEAIESVFLQTYRHWELLLVDDGSTDASKSIADEYVIHCPSKVFCFAHPGHENLGLPASRNLGLQKARGRYVALLDADDVWLPSKLQDQVGILESHPDAGLVYGRSRYWKSWNGDSSEADCTPDLGVPTNSLIPGQQLLVSCYPLGKAVTPCPSDLLFRRTALERARAFEDWPFNFYEDQAFLARVYLENAVFVADACWDKYRVHSQSCSAVVFESGQYDKFREFYFDWLERYLRLKGIRDAEIWSLLGQAQRQYGHPLLRNIRRMVRRVGRGQRPGDSVRLSGPSKEVSFGDLRRVTPFSRNWGYERGVPIDRYYIENFLAGHANDIRGRVLEIGDDTYTRRFGGERVTTRDVLHVGEGNPKATVVADLASAPQIRSDTFDCIILTQTLQLIYDTRACLGTCFRILKPGGVLLATFPGISQIDDGEWGQSWCWAFTTTSSPPQWLRSASGGTSLPRFLSCMGCRSRNCDRKNWTTPIHNIRC